jgi:hypothetical protein
MQINNHIQEILNTTSRALLYNSDNPELKSIFKDIVERLHACQDIMRLDDKYKLNDISEALDSVVALDSELTHLEVTIQIKPVLKEKKTAKISAKLYTI